MLRIKEELLTKKDEKYYYNEHIYNGVIYFIDKELVTAKKIVKEGVIVDDYINNMIGYLEDGVDVLTRDLETHDLDEYFIYQDKPLHGMGYGFSDEGDCIIEYYCDYAPDGKVKSISYDQVNDTWEDNLWEYKYRDSKVIMELEWDNKELISYRVHRNADNQMRIEFENNGQLKSLKLAKNYFQDAESFWDFSEKKVDVIRDKSFLKNVTVAKQLNLFSEGMNDELFRDLAENNGLGGLERLSIMRTKLTKLSIEKLKDITSLKKIEVDGPNIESMLDTLNDLKKKNQNCEVFVDIPYDEMNEIGEKYPHILLKYDRIYDLEDTSNYRVGAEILI